MRGKYGNRAELKRKRAEAATAQQLADHQSELRQRMAAAEETQSDANQRLIGILPHMHKLADMDMVRKDAESEYRALKAIKREMRASLRQVGAAMKRDIVTFMHAKEAGTGYGPDIISGAEFRFLEMLEARDLVGLPVIKRDRLVRRKKSNAVNTGELLLTPMDFDGDPIRFADYLRRELGDERALEYISELITAVDFIADGQVEIEQMTQPRNRSNP